MDITDFRARRRELSSEREPQKGGWKERSNERKELYLRAGAELIL